MPELKSNEDESLPYAAQAVIRIGGSMYKDGKSIFPITNLYLNKLLYFLNAIHLVVNKNHKPLFTNTNSKFQKWNYGPTIPSVYNMFDSYHEKPIPYTADFNYITASGEMDPKSKAFIKKYLPKLLKFSPFTLVYKACTEPQWKNTNRGAFQRVSAVDLNTSNTRDYNIPAILSAEANYSNMKTQAYYSEKKNQFWNHPTKRARQVLDELNNDKLGKQIRDTIKIQARNEFLITGIHKEYNRIMFHGYNTDGSVDADFEISPDAYSHSYVARYESVPITSPHLWKSRSIPKAIIGCSVLNNTILCKWHNDEIGMAKEQQKEVGKVNVASTEKRTHWAKAYEKQLVNLFARGNFDISAQIAKEAKNLKRINKTDIRSFRVRSLHVAPIDNIINNNKVNGFSSGSGAKTLDKMIGLNSVKKQMKIYIRSAKVAKRMRQLGQNSHMKSLDMIFLGNPGTGKTKVARLVGKILSENKIIPKDKFIECSAKDLIGGYTGQTGHKTAKLIQRAIGGVLFIDEAYILAPDPQEHDSGSDYRSIAITELIRQAENHRNDLVIILAGYEKLMENLIHNGNPGLRSRFNHIIHFPDYTNSEMLDIFKLHAKSDEHCLINKANYQLIKKGLPKFIKHAKACGDDSNGRLMRNLLQAIVESRNYRIGMKVSNMTLRQINTISKSDIKNGFKQAYKVEANAGKKNNKK